MRPFSEVTGHCCYEEWDTVTKKLKKCDKEGSTYLTRFLDTAAKKNLPKTLKKKNSVFHLCKEHSEFFVDSYVDNEAIAAEKKNKAS